MFSVHKSDCGELQHLSDNDFESLLRLCLTSDVVLIEGIGYTQKSGLAMGNNLAPTLAIIYMNSLDQGIQTPFDNNVHLRRYIDDMFVAWSSDHITPESVLSSANSLNSALKFTIETPDNNRLPFLDTVVTLHPEKGSFSSTLYIKPIHSQCLTPWDSHGPLSLKRGTLVGEIKRAITRSTDAQSQRASIKLITKLHKRNGYPKRFVTSTIKRTLRTCNIQPTEQELAQDPVYIKVPFINEVLKQQTQAVIKRSGIQNIKVHYMTGRPLSSIFRPPKEQQKCPEACETCTSAKKVNKCLSKNCVYIIECTHCHLVYIGETSRTVGSRIKEHVRMKKQTIYQHLVSHTNTPMLKDISWDILHNNIPQHQTRKIIEALEIRKKNTETIMNGCIGRVLTIH